MRSSHSDASSKERPSTTAILRRQLRRESCVSRSIIGFRLHSASSRRIVLRRQRLAPQVLRTKGKRRHSPHSNLRSLRLQKGAHKACLFQHAASYSSPQDCLPSSSVLRSFKRDFSHTPSLSHA